MSNNQKYDGALISELGVKRYLKATKDIKTSNINFFLRGAAAEKAWEECNFGCHGPTYRNLKKASTFAEALKPIDDLSPVLAGFIDGVHHNTIGQAEKLGGGVKRTAEGLHLTGSEDFQNVGDENYAVYEFASNAIEKVFSFELDSIENPLTQSIITIINDYISALPEWIIEETFTSGAMKFPQTIDTVWIIKAVSMGIIKNTTTSDVKSAATLLGSPAQRFVGKQIGKKFTVAMAAVIASTITKKILASNSEIPRLKRRLVRIRNAARKAKGGLGGTLLKLLGAQGILDHAAVSSRKLQSNNPRVWQILRYDLKGANMAFFLIENIVQEYLDRLSLLEKQPSEFAKVMEALIRERQTTKIFIPF